MPKTKNDKSRTAIIFRKQGNILGVNITGTPRSILLIQIADYLSEIEQKQPHLALNKPLIITTPNPEQVLMASKDSSLQEILKKSDVSLCDGVGLLAAYDYNLQNPMQSHLQISFERNNTSINSLYKLLKKIIAYYGTLIRVLAKNESSDGLKIIKGRDFFFDLQNIANNRRYKVFLLGSTFKVLEKTLDLLKIKYPSVQYRSDPNIKLNNDGVPVNVKEKNNEKLVVDRINAFKPDFLFVAFGSPKQEKWVYRYLENLNTNLIMVVGGTFNHIAGTRIKTPKIIERLGLEWFWRLMTGSQNFQRIYNAVIKFPLLVLTES